MEFTTWPTVDFQVTLKDQVLISRLVMGKSLKFCLLLSCCHWFNLRWAGVLCCALVRSGKSVIPSRGPIQTASGFNLPQSISFLWEEYKVNCGNNGSTWSFCSRSWWWSPFVVWKAGWAPGCPWPSGRSVQLCCWQWIHWDTCDLLEGVL